MPEIKDRPILFSAPMVTSILEGRKTQTRRVINPQPCDYKGGVHPNHVAKHPAPYFDSYCNGKRTEANPRGMSVNWCWWTEDDRQGADWIRCRYGVPGDRLWVKEPFGYYGAGGDKLAYRATPPDWWDDEKECLYDGWHSPLFMLRKHSRILLEVVSIRVERVQDISESDCLAEGVVLTADADKPANFGGAGNWSVPGLCRYSVTPQGAYSTLWDSINGEKKAEKNASSSWGANPYVWVVEFKVIEPSKGAF